MKRLMIQMIKLFLAMELFYHCFTLVLYKPTNLLTENKMLFNSNTSALSFKNYLIPYYQAFINLPSITYGINNYQTGNRFYYQNIQTTISRIERDGFILDVNPILITSIHKFSICYLAIDDSANFVILMKSYQNPIVSSKRNDYRSVVLRDSYNFSRTGIAGTVSIRGFYIQSVTNFYVASQLSNINNKTFNIIIGTYSDCSINRLDFSLFFYYPDLTADDYVIFVSNNYCFQNTSNRAAYTIALTTDTSVFYFGVSGFGGKTVDCYADMGWGSSFISNNTIHININVNASHLQYVCYNFIQIFALRPYVPPVINSTAIINSTNSTSSTNHTTNATTPPPNPPQATPKSQDSQITLLIIVVVIVCTLTLLIIVICAIRHYWYNKYYEQETIKLSKKQLSLASIQQLPTINF